MGGVSTGNVKGTRQGLTWLADGWQCQIEKVRERGIEGEARKEGVGGREERRT